LRSDDVFSAVVFNWIDDDKDGVITKEDLTRGLGSIKKLFIDAFVVIIKKTPEAKRYLTNRKAEELARRFLHWIPSKYYRRTVDFVFDGRTAMTLDEWCDIVCYENDYSFKRSCVLAIISSRCGSFITSDLRMLQNFTFAALSPVALYPNELEDLDTKLHQYDWAVVA